MDELFPTGPGMPDSAKPLSARMRPRNLEEYVGQEHILGPGRLLRRAIEADRLSSVIFYGPPGTGKTSLAQIIAATTSSRFERLSGVESNVAEIRKVAAAAALRLSNSKQRTILFVDEIHRFNKAQQDVLLPDVENGTLRFIGATTHNPFFYVNSPLVSRSQVFQLVPLTVDDLLSLMSRAISAPDRGLGGKVHLQPDAARHLATVSDGDARRCLNALEIAALTTPADADGGVNITLEIAAESIQTKAIVYDGDGDAHYDTASAFIKSMRGCDPDAAIYWLAKMLHAGEDIRFISRRLIICASEDIGMADSNALQVALAAHQAAEILGLPEAALVLAHATIYVATAPKSNSSTLAIGAATEDVTQGRTLAVPAHLRDAHYAGAKQLGHGAGYKYGHDYEGGYVPQAYLPEGRSYYHPTEHGMEKRVKERLEYWRSLFEKDSEA